jgi:hypothetical protein
VKRLIAGSSIGCVEAFAVGQATVTVATGTDAAEGGSRAIQGSHILRSHPTATPDGDVSALIGAPAGPAKAGRRPLRSAAPTCHGCRTVKDRR